MEKVRSIKDKKGNKVAMIVPVETWEKLLYEVEMAEDERDAREARRDNKYVSFEEVHSQIYAR